VNRLRLITAATVIGIGASLLASHAQVPSNRADEDAIKVVINSTTDAFNHRRGFW
jgi:hypothetical protein